MADFVKGFFGNQKPAQVSSSGDDGTFSNCHSYKIMPTWACDSTFRVLSKQRMPSNSIRTLRDPSYASSSLIYH